MKLVQSGAFYSKTQPKHLVIRFDTRLGYCDVSRCSVGLKRRSRKKQGGLAAADINRIELYCSARGVNQTI